MNVIITGATGMVGQGVVAEAIQNSRIEKILLIGRGKSNIDHPKVTEIIVANFMDISLFDNILSNCDLSIFCLGTTSFHKGEDKYRAITYNITTLFAEELKRQSPDCSFIYISGAGVSENSKFFPMKVKWYTEQKLRSLNFKKLYILRPLLICPSKEIKLRGLKYKIIFSIIRVLYPILRRCRGLITTTTAIGTTAVNLAPFNYNNEVIENHEIDRLASIYSRSP